MKAHIYFINYQKLEHVHCTVTSYEAGESVFPAQYLEIFSISISGYLQQRSFHWCCVPNVNLNMHAFLYFKPTQAHQGQYGK